MTTKYLGICMDHARAHIMPFTDEPIETTEIDSSFIHSDKTLSFEKGEKAMHHKEQRDLSAYYKEIAAVMKEYDEVILFGPTEAKVELYNILKVDHHFDKIKMEIRPTDKMTENQEHAFVREYFKKISCAS